MIGHAKRNAGSVDAVLARSSGRPRTRHGGGSRATTACLSRPGDLGRLIEEPTRVPGHLGRFNPARQVAEDGADETPSENPQPQKDSPLTCSHPRTHGAGRLLAEIWDEVAVHGSEVPRGRPCVGLAGDGDSDNSRVEGGDRGVGGAMMAARQAAAKELPSQSPPVPQNPQLLGPRESFFPYISPVQTPFRCH